MGKAKAGLILGIASLACYFISWFLPETLVYVELAMFIAALPLAIVGLVLSAKAGKAAKANGQKSGIATAGLVVGIVATVLAGLGFGCVLCVVCAVIAAAGALA